MTLTEIKKALYKQKPFATFYHCRKTLAGVYLVYGCEIGDNKGLPNVIFDVPVEELGVGIIGNSIEVQLLIQYIVQPEIAQP